MKEAAERDRGLLSLVERIMKRPVDATPAPPNAEQSAAADAIPADQHKQVESLEPQISVEATRTLTAAELADVMLRALQAIDGCPRSGFEVIVYGLKPWNAMLRITPAAGPLHNASVWRERVQAMVPRLRDQYQLAE